MAKQRNKKKKQRRKARKAHKTPAKQLTLFESDPSTPTPAGTEPVESPATPLAADASPAKAPDLDDQPELFPRESPDPQAREARAPESSAVVEPSAPTARRGHAEDRGAVAGAAVSPKPASRFDRAVGDCVAAAVVVCLADAVVIWGLALDVSGVTTLQVVAASLAALAAGWAWAGAASAIGMRLARWTHLAAFLGPKENSSGAGRPAHSYWPTRVLGVAVLLAGLCSVLTTVAAFSAKRLVHSLTRTMLWTPLGWTGLKLVLVFVGTLPLGLAWAGVLAAGRQGARDSRVPGEKSAGAARWSWGAAGGLAAFAAGWWCGVPVVGSALLAGVVLAGLAVVLLQRPVEPDQALTRPAPEVRPGRREALKIAACWGLVGLLLAVQARLLQDCVGATVAGQALWLAATGALVALMSMKASIEARAESPIAQIGVLIGLLVTGMLQAGLCVTALSVRTGWTSDSWSLLTFAALAQVPFAWFVASLPAPGPGLRSSRGRGARVGGLALGVAGYLIVVGSPAGRVILGIGAIGVVVAFMGFGLKAVQEKWKKQVLMCSGLVLVFSLAAIVWFAATGARVSAAGRWLTWLDGPGDGADSSCGGGAVLRERWRSESVTDCLRQVLSNADHKGIWWAAVADEDDLAGLDVTGVRFVRSAADPAIVTARSSGAGIASEADFFRMMRASGRKFDGVLLSLLPGDHPQADRVYCESVLAALRRAAWKRHKSKSSVGPVVLRTQVAHDRLDQVLRLARTFQSVAPSGWAVLARGPKRVDVLLVAPASAMVRPTGPGLVVWDLERLRGQAPDVGVLKWLRPRAIWQRQAVEWSQLEGAAPGR